MRTHWNRTNEPLAIRWFHFRGTLRLILLPETPTTAIMMERKGSSVSSTEASVPLVQASHCDEPLLIHVPVIVPNDDDSSTTFSTSDPSTYLNENDTGISAAAVDKKTANAAGVGSAVIGFLVLGPLGAIVLGLGATHYAKHKKCVLGDSARAVGEVALFVQERFREVRQQQRNRTAQGDDH